MALQAGGREGETRRRRGRKRHTGTWVELGPGLLAPIPGAAVDGLRGATAVRWRGEPRGAEDPKAGEPLTSGRGALPVVSPGWTERVVAAKNAARELERKGLTSPEGSPSPPGELEGAPPGSAWEDVGPPVSLGLLAQPASLESR